MVPGQQLKGHTCVRTLYSRHSLRSGQATSAAAGGATGRAIMEQPHHRSLQQVRQYIRRASLFQDNAAACSGYEGPGNPFGDLRCGKAGLQIESTS